MCVGGGTNKLFKYNNLFVLSSVFAWVYCLLKVFPSLVFCLSSNYFVPLFSFVHLAMSFYACFWNKKINHENPSMTLNLLCLHQSQGHGPKWLFDFHFLKFSERLYIFLTNGHYRYNFKKCLLLFIYFQMCKIT